MFLSKLNGPTLSFTTARITTFSLLQPPTYSTNLLSSHQYSKSRRINITTSNKSSKNPTATPTIDEYSSSYKPKVNEEEEEEVVEKFDWYAQWYPVMPVCDLDKRKPHAIRVIGLDVVVWWDRNESQWKVFNDSCPHRFAPLSEGRIDPSGRLQCVYHGWCFNGSGHCKFIPQAPTHGPQVHTSKKACAIVYPSTVQNEIVWFWPNSDPQFKDILQKKKPPFFAELDDPSNKTLISQREINYGYEVLIENVMDPAHLPYAHYGLMNPPTPEIKVDKEGGFPLNLSINDMDINGFSAKQDDQDFGIFFAPCVYYQYNTYPDLPPDDNESISSGTDKKVASVAQQSQFLFAAAQQKRFVLIFICIPVSPGKSRLLSTFSIKSANWVERNFPRWLHHVEHNLALDSDLYLLHLQEKKLMEFGPKNWHKSCFLPTKSDAITSGYRRWLNKYSEGQVNWGSKFNAEALPQSPPREELLDRYWTHVVNCSSCSVAYRRLNRAETILKVIAFGLIGVLGLIKHGMVNMSQRTAIFAMAILCFGSSKWLSRYIYKSFHFHDYSHALL